ncbi:MAG: cytochrome C [Proteobacteria bacterium]|nr:cytochrome C [Pseudomonadota bacterium]
MFTTYLHATGYKPCAGIDSKQITRKEAPMSVFIQQKQRRFRAVSRIVVGGLSAMALFSVLDAQALPLFARQTGQNCVACHAGGQFPELTQYGRMFKLTGYTIGDRVAVPVSVMGLITYSKVGDIAKSDDPGSDFQKNGVPMFAGASTFIGGKITDNLGAFVQLTYDNYAGQNTEGRYFGHSQADNIDIRYADRLIDANRDLIFGISLNNNPSISDPWNTAAAWMQYVPVPSPTSNRFVDGTTPYPGFGSGGNIAGLSLYAYLNRMFYAELGAYKTANRAFSFLSAGLDDASTTKLRGTNNPYWRLALTHEWGPHNLMLGTSGMVAHVYDSGSDTSDPDNLGRFKNTGVDAQYQYLLDPHTVTAQAAYMRQKTNYSVNGVAAASPYFLSDGITPVAPANDSDTTNTFRAKLSYVYQAKYGGSLSFFNMTGTTNTLNQSSGYDSNGQITSTDPLGTGITSTRVAGNLSGNPAKRGLTYEAFWMPVQYVRVGAQYTNYSKFNGASDNYDGLGRNARDNNSLFLYIWGAY